MESRSVRALVSSLLMFLTTPEMLSFRASGFSFSSPTTRYVGHFTDTRSSCFTTPMVVSSQYQTTSKRCRHHLFMSSASILHYVPLEASNTDAGIPYFDAENESPQQSENAEATAEGEPQPPTTRSKIYSRLVPQARRPFTEVGMRYRSDDWIKNLLSIPRSYLLRRIKSHLIFDQLVCILVLVARKKLGWKSLSIPFVAHTLLGSFLGLLLVFRTNSSYSRFEEARGYWAKVSSICRSLALESVSFIRGFAPKNAEVFEKLLIAFPDVLAYTCLAGNTMKARLPPSIKDLLYDKDEDLMNSNEKSHVVNGAGERKVEGGEMKNATIEIDPSTLVLHKLFHHLYQASAEGEYKDSVLFRLHISTMGMELCQLGDALSGCEKIVKTPVPLSYSRHTSRFLTLWCGTLPLAIVQELGWLSVPVMFTVSWLLYGIEEIGHLIEQPFVPVSVKPSYLISDDVNDDDRSSKTLPYDIGMPVCTLAEQIRSEVKKIVSLE
mmetsp:Transcript_18156/g.37172  ORF Transcript_18156/g.37172 Transcript_18156/m.37172 type:complete len:494 (-) Transcript_18156:176-1657(-)